MIARSLCAFVVVLSLLAPRSAQALSKHFDPQKMMPSSEVRRGMKAVGKTVFYGVSVTDFNVEILGVLEKANSGQDLILGRILDGPLVERQCGVIGGMSGSPVFIDGRLIGAIAYTWNFEREPIAGITAIDSMLEALDKPESQQALAPAETRAEEYTVSSAPLELRGHQVTRVSIVPRSEAKQPFADEHTLVMSPVAAPVYCSGLAPRAQQYLAERLKPYGIEPVAGPGSMSEPVDVEIEPGAAFGALLASGDFDISTGGTITYRDGDLVLGFGHPFMELGTIDMALTTSYVHDFVPCYSRTDKQMSPMKEVGVLTQDRPWAVGGKLGPTASRIPATFKITDEVRGLTRTYHVNIINNREVTPMILASCAMSAIAAAYSSPGEGMITAKTTVKGRRGDVVTREDTYYHESSFLDNAITDLMQGAAMLTQNRFKPQDVAEVLYEASLSAQDNTAVIEGVYVDQPVAKAGEDLTLRVRLRPDDGQVVEQTVTLPMPLELEQGRVRVGVCSGMDAMRLRARLGILPPTFYSLQDVIRHYAKLEKGNQLFAAAVLPGRALSVEGTRLGLVPEFVADILEKPSRSDVTRGGTEVSACVDTPWVIYGGEVLTLQAEDREGGKTKDKGTGERPKSEEGGETFVLPDPPPTPPGVPPGLWWCASAFTRAKAPVPPQQVSDHPTHQVNSDEPDGDTQAKQDEKAEDTDEEAPEEGEEAAKSEEKESKKEEGKVAREPAVWSQTSAQDFAAGEPHGLAIRSDGAVQLVASWSDPINLQAAYVWSLTAVGDTAYIGTVNPGKIYRLTGDKPELLYDTDQFGVSALCPAKDGAILAATFPDSQVLHITPDGKAQTICTLEDCVWDMVPDDAGGAYLGLGPKARVCHLDQAGKVAEVCQIRQGHVSRLLRQGDDLYIATAGDGALYRLGADKKLVSLYSAGDNDVTGLVPSPQQGHLVLATAPAGAVISLDPKGTATTLYENSDVAVLSLLSARGRLFAGLGEAGKVLEIQDADTHIVLREDDGSQVLRLCAAGSKLLAACSNPGALFVADLDGAATGHLESRVLDAGRRSQWGRVDWQATVPDGAHLNVRFRSGSSGEPKDRSWTDWSAPLTEPGRDKLQLPPGQFLQYRLEMSKDPGAVGPTLDWIRVAYLPANQKPVVKEPNIKEGDAISGKHKLEWKASDPDGDTTVYTLLFRPRGKRDFTAFKENLLKSEYEWDTKSVADGVYDLRIVASDALANPADPQEARLDIANITIDNTPPEITVLSGPALQSDGGFALTGFALDDNCPVKNVAWKEEGGDLWRAVRLDDTMYDWRYERFLIVTPPLKETVQALIIRARDAAGNVTDKTIKLPRPETGKEKAENKGNHRKPKGTDRGAK